MGTLKASFGAALKQEVMQLPWLRPEFELAPLVPHGVVCRPAGGRGPGHAREGLGVDGDVGRLLLQQSRVAGVHHPKHVQEAQGGEHLTHVPGGKTARAR